MSSNFPNKSNDPKLVRSRNNKPVKVLYVYIFMAETQKCPVLEDRPGHGYVRCQNIEEENSKMCFIGCEPGYFFVSGQNNYLTCGPSTGFVWSHKRANHKAVLPSCTRKYLLQLYYRKCWPGDFKTKFYCISRFDLFSR